MVSLLLTFTSAVCLAVMVGATGHRSCGLGQGVVCMPTVCSLSKCLLFKNATCIDDKCGCEGRFFTYIEKDKTYQDVTKMCSSGNVVLNFANFTDSSIRQNDETISKPRPFVRFFYHFNNLVTEILTDLVGHLRMCAEKRPTQANIDLAKKASTSLENLKNMTAEHRELMKTMKKPVADGDVVHDEDQDQDEDADAKIDEAIKKVFKTNPHLAPHAKWALKGIKDEDANDKSPFASEAEKEQFAKEAAATIAKKLAAYKKALKAGRRVADEDSTDVKMASGLNLFKAHADILHDILDEDYNPVGSRGQTGVLDEDASTTLKEFTGRGFFSSLISTVLPVVQNLLGF